MSPAFQKPVLEVFEFTGQGLEIDQSDPVVPFEGSRTFAGIENKTALDFLQSVEMGVAVEGQVMVGRKHALEIPGVVNHHDLPSGPVEFQGAVMERHAIAFRGFFEGFFFAEVVVAVYAMDFRGESGEGVEYFCLCDVTGMDDPFDVTAFKDFSDPFDALHVVVRVAEYTDSHSGLLLSLAFFPHPFSDARSPEGYHVRLSSGRSRAKLSPDQKPGMGEDMAYETLLTDLEDGILTVTLNRPDRLNAFNDTMQQDLLDLYEYADTEDAVRVVIVTGAGRAFCAGADLGAGTETFATRKAEEGEARSAPREPHRDGGGLVTLRTFECRKPVIAAINGPAVGVGVTMTLPMDIRLASEKAKIGFVFARRGLVPEAASSWFLPRIVGISKSMEWVATGRIFGPQEALEQRLVSEVLAEEDLLPRAREIASEIVANTSGVAVALARQMLWKMLGATHPMEAHRVDSQAIEYMGARPDVAEGVSSFLEKRPPEFSMKVSRDLPDFFPWWEDPPFSD